MIFKDITIISGRVSSRQVIDSRELETWAVEKCAAMLQQLREGAAEVEHGLEDMVPFSVRLSIPSYFPEAPGNDLFFCVGAPGGPPFQFNVLVRSDAPENDACWAIVTLFGVSCVAESGMNQNELEEMVPPLYEERPAVLSTVLPIEGATPERIVIASDFAKCFAAALLTEERP